MDVLKEIKKSNVSYHVLGKSDRSAMPLGNGELCASVWVDQKGEICFYISRSDAITELDRTVKLGLVRVALSPNPFINGDFCQTLDVADGCICFRGKNTDIRMFIDVEKNHIILEGECEDGLAVSASVHVWRKEKARFCGEFDAEGAASESPDIVAAEDGGILFYHKNGSNIIAETALVQEVEEAIGDMPDLLTDRIFGGYLYIEGGRCRGLEVVKEKAGNFVVRIATESFQGSEAEFKRRLIQKQGVEEPAAVRAKCRKFWNAYWENSYIFVKGDPQGTAAVKEEVLKEAGEPLEYTTEEPSAVTRAYILTRFMLKCCQNGKLPILYNGMLFNLCPGKNGHFQSKSFGKVCTAPPGEFTVDSNPDERPWCVEQLWQNIRHPYHTFLAQGEEDALKVLFSYYRRFWKLNRFRAKKYYAAEGQHNTEMTLSFGLQSIGIYGADRNGKPPGYAQNRHGGSVDISPGLELLSLMLDYYGHTGDSAFFKEEIEPYAEDLYRYIETRFTKREKGKLVLEPLNSVETYWDTKNPFPVVAGLWGTSARLLAAKDLSGNGRKYFEGYQKQIPELCSRHEDGELVFQPAEEFEEVRKNVEIPELYACFPFWLFNQFRDEGGVMKRTFEKRLRQHHGNQRFIIGESTVYPSYSGWQSHGIVAALLGMTELAQEILAYNVQLKNPGTRFPAMWGPVYDGVPDTDHGANIVHLLQKMVMQVDQDKIYILPAFPEKWDVSFRLYPDKNTAVEVEYGNGDLKKVDVYPESARERLVIRRNNV